MTEGANATSACREELWYRWGANFEMVYPVVNPCYRPINNPIQRKGCENEEQHHPENY